MVSYTIHSDVAGVFKDIWIDDHLKENNIVEYNLFCKTGDEVTAFTGSNGTLGTIILKYKSMDEMLEKMNNMNKYVKVFVE